MFHLTSLCPSSASLKFPFICLLSFFFSQSGAAPPRHALPRLFWIACETGEDSLAPATASWTDKWSAGGKRWKNAQLNGQRTSRPNWSLFPCWSICPSLLTPTQMWGVGRDGGGGPTRPGLLSAGAWALTVKHRCSLFRNWEADSVESTSGGCGGQSWDLQVVDNWRASRHTYNCTFYDYEVPFLHPNQTSRGAHDNTRLH